MTVPEPAPVALVPPDHDPPTTTAHELLAIYSTTPSVPRRRLPREFAFLCPSCGEAHIVVGHPPLTPTTHRAPCGAQVRLVPGPPISLPVALWRTNVTERMLAALYPALIRARIAMAGTPKPASSPQADVRPSDAGMVATVTNTVQERPGEPLAPISCPPGQRDVPLLPAVAASMAGSNVQ